jgi:two-component system chemotaxis response regulator CheY
MSMKIVIADDAPFIREILAQLLIIEGFQVVGEAADGEQAVAIVLEQRPDVVLMDVVMPVMSGIEATRRILARWPEARIIACSTVDHAAVVQQAIEAGCQDYVQKPFDRDRLMKALKIDGGTT